jgi:amino acid transporter
MTLLDSTSIIVGIIIGSSIYLSTPLIAQQVPNVGWLVGVWVIGAVLTLVGALCYAELATAYPKAGGDYVFLTEAFGRKTGFLFAWAQFWIVRPGSVGTLAFVFADYANRLCPLPGDHPVLIYAVGAVVVLSGINLLGVRAGKLTQNLLTVVKFLGLLAIVAIGMCFSATPTAMAEPSVTSSLDLGFAMIFVFYAYSGWNEIAYVSAEVRHPQKNILRALMLGTLAVSVLYIAVNLAFVHALGLAGLQNSHAVAADATLGVGPWAANCISLLICITALGAINGMIFTGARILYAMGTEHRLYSWLGQWNAKTDAPALPLMIQAAVSVALTIGFGWTHERQGFADSIAFTSPAFWLFLFLVGLALFVLRERPSEAAPTFRVPFYPLVPLLFCLSNSYMFYKSLDYAILQARWGLLASAIVLGIGAVLSFVK